MIGTVIAALIGNYMTTCFVIGLLVAAVRVWRHRGPRTALVVSELFLNNFILWAIGAGQAINFVMHSFFGDFAASTIGWAQSPFQLELAFASLGVAVIAFMLHGPKVQLRAKAAQVVALAIFGYGAAAGHVYQTMVNHDHAVNNGGLLLTMDVVIATVGIALVIWRSVAGRRHPAAVDTVATPEPAISR